LTLGRIAIFGGEAAVLMVLVFDIGNTNIVLGVYRGKELLAHWRLSTNRQQTADEYGILIKTLFNCEGLAAKDVTAMVISSVVPPLMDNIEQMARTFFGVEPLLIGPGIKTGIKILYDNPKEVGADRIVNAVAALAKYGGPVIVVDFGTATAFDAINAAGDYLGGAIVPGIRIAAEALFQRAAKLPRIELARPKTAIGRNIVTSMQSGIVFGYAGLVDAIVRRFRAEMGGSASVVATGSLAELIAAESETIQTVDPLLTLEGLRLLYERNRGQG
jgi:type III pantothenate kinase